MTEATRTLCEACQDRGWVWEGNASTGEGTPADCPECALEAMLAHADLRAARKNPLEPRRPDPDGTLIGVLARSVREQRDLRDYFAGRLTERCKDVASLKRMLAGGEVSDGSA